MFTSLLAQHFVHNALAAGAIVATIASSSTCRSLTPTMLPNRRLVASVA